MVSGTLELVCESPELVCEFLKLVSESLELVSGSQLSILSDIIITDYIVTDTSFHGHNYSRSTVSGKFFIFPTVNINFRLKE